MSKTLTTLTVAGGVTALAAIFGDTTVDPAQAHCQLGGDYYASIVRTADNKVLRASGISVNGNRCTVDAGNELVHYVVR